MRGEFLIVSDIHVDDYAKFSKIDAETGLGTRLKHCLDIFDQIFEYGEEHGIKTLLVGGDVFDKRGFISVPVYVSVYEKFRGFLERGWKVYSIVGNHDQATRSGLFDSLKPLPMTLRVGTTGFCSGVAGYKVGFVAFCESPKIFLENLYHVAKNKPDVYLIHQGINGAKIAGDEILARDEVSLGEILDIVGHDAWVFSGHYHIHQNLSPKVCFIGSAVPKDFGDKTPKGFLHFDGKGFKQIESRAPKFFEVDAVKLYSQSVVEGLKGHYVKVNYVGEEPSGVEKLGFGGWIASKLSDAEDKGETRESIDPSASPMSIISSYLDVLEREEKLSLPRADLLKALEVLTEGKSIDQVVGSCAVTLKTLEIHNFLSHQKSEVNFESYAGVVTINGENLDDPSALSNGSGKSTIPEALKWVLFGKTLRGLSGDDVVNVRVGKDCYVKLSFSVGGNPYSLYRYRKHNKHKNQVMLFEESGEVFNDLRGKSDAETQEKLLKILGIDELTFDNTIFFGQGFSNAFAGLTDKEQKAILENVLGMGAFFEIYEKAKDIAVEARRKYESAISLHSSFSSELEREQHSLAVAENNFKSFEENLKDEVTRLRAEILEVKDSSPVCGNFDAEEYELAKLKKDMGALEEPAELRGLEQELREVKSCLQTANDGIVQLSQAIVVAKEKAREFSKNAERIANEIDSLVGKTCPTCSQNLQNEDERRRLLNYRNKQLDELRLRQDEKEKQAEDMTEELAEYHAMDKELKEREAQLVEKINSLRKELSQVKISLVKNYEAKRHELELLKRSVAMTAARLKRLEAELSEKLVASNPHESYVKERREKLRTLSFEMVKQDEIKKKSHEAYSSFKFWENAFSDKGTPETPPLKTYLFESVVPILDDMARRFSDKMTSGSIEVRFSTVSRLKNGECRDKFQVTAHNKFGASSYLGDSGGERRKIDIVVMFALHSLARIRSGSKFDVLFMDEVLDYLDKEGCERVMSLLWDMNREIEKIFVITHNENLKGYFSSSLDVVKEGGVSSIRSAA